MTDIVLAEPMQDLIGRLLGCGWSKRCVTTSPVEQRKERYAEIWQDSKNEFHIPQFI
ncbi:hypothetical protein NXW72_23225 [Bacteroides fragilis]|nr:hypothetical protein [Bacteroides fragilis]